MRSGGLRLSGACGAVGGGRTGPPGRCPVTVSGTGAGVAAHAHRTGRYRRTGRSGPPGAQVGLPGAPGLPAGRGGGLRHAPRAGGGVTPHLSGPGRGRGQRLRHLFLQRRRQVARRVVGRGRLPPGRPGRVSTDPSAEVVEHHPADVRGQRPEGDARRLHLERHRRRTVVGAGLDPGLGPDGERGLPGRGEGRLHQRDRELGRHLRRRRVVERGAHL